MENCKDDKNTFNKDPKKCLDEVIKKINDQTQKEEEIVSNSIYINWLESFTEKYPTFISDGKFYSDEFTKDEDVNIDNLKYFFYGIDNYARKNYICPLQSNDYSYYYNIKANNKGYEIGVLIGQGSKYYCKCVKIDEKLNFIDFNDIINSKRNLDSEDIDKYLEDIAYKVLELNKKGIPLKDIFESTYNITMQTKKLTR